MLPPSASGFSPHPPVSVYGTGGIRAIEAFLGGRTTGFPTWVSVRVTPYPYGGRLFRPPDRCACPRDSVPGPRHRGRVPSFLPYAGAGISTCCPSATALALALGPGFPAEDKLYRGNLGYSAGRIPTFLSLLIPAFSLPCAPRALPVTLRRARDAPLPGGACAPPLRLRRCV